LRPWWKGFRIAISGARTERAPSGKENQAMRHARNVVAAASGVVFAAAGIEHGVGEILQGSVPPPALVFPSWPDSDFLGILSGEPAMSILPDLRLTGLVTVVVSLLAMAWSLLLLRRERGALVQILLYVVLLLVGGGLAPPVMGIILAGVAARGEAILAREKADPASRPPTALARYWQAALVVGVAGYLGLLPGVPLLYLLFRIESAALIGVLALLSFGGLLVALLGAMAWDRDHVGLRARAALGQR
jgi:hypothetical protein